MKKSFPYIVGSLVFLAVLVLAIAVKRERKMDERMTFNKNDKIPYGTYVAYQQLKYLFPDAALTSSLISPAYWDTGFYGQTAGRALLIITPQFIANETEMNNLIVFAQKGNDVFISTRQSSIMAQDYLKVRSSASFGAFESGDSVTLTLNKPPFPLSLTKSYPGRKYQSYLYKYDSSITSVLGYNDEQDAVFIHLRTGEGNIYMHVAPVAFTNYFLLHKNNMEYYDAALSVLPKNTREIIWDEYFLHKLYDQNKEEDRGLLHVLFKYPPFKWGLLTAIFTLGIYVLLEMRRKQRFIPALERPRNDSLDFVKTIGRLYYEKNDHRDLARKMGLYFLDHVRNSYRLSTGTLDEEFVKTLHLKSGYNESDLKKIISFISFVQEAPGITDMQLAEFHQDLQAFYRNT